MANREHLAVLEEGADVWNRWRDENATIRPDLHGANLTEANLIGANLREANLREAKLAGADLRGADLAGANLRGANLRKAELNAAKLPGAALRQADCGEANLRGADLRSADLRGADLSEANLNQTQLCDANLKRTNLKASRLIDARLDGATLTGAQLWESQHAGWSIRRVVCEYAFWNEEGDARTEYAPGEFERLHSASQAIEVIYEGGASRVEVDTLPMLVKELERRHAGVRLRLKALAEAPGGSKATIAVEESGDQKVAMLQREAQELQRVVRIREKQVIALQAKLDVYQLEFHQLLETKMGTNISIGGDVHGNVVGEVKDSATITYTSNELDGITSLMRDLLRRREEWERAAGDKAVEIKAAIDTVARETTADGPDMVKLQSALRSIKTALDSVKAAVDLGQKIGQYLPLT